MSKQEDDYIQHVMEEDAKRRRALHALVKEQLDNSVENGQHEDPALCTPEHLANDLLAYSVDFEDEKWTDKDHKPMLVEACKAWLDAHPNRK